MNFSVSNEKANLLDLMPSTRYQGSKRRILPWIFKEIRDRKFSTALDGFGGTASVSYLFKLMGKKVTFNDLLLSNYQTGIALIENDLVKLNQNDIDFLLQENGFEYPTFIQDTFEGIYFLEPENKWLDMISFNIEKLSEKYNDEELLKRKRALAFHILFQACLSKRPFNLFHRKNLNLRLTNVKRSFGNKTTWDTDFKTLFLRFYKEISQRIFSNGMKNKAICKDIMGIKDNDFDLVYLDPPYTRSGESHPKDYHALYHFLEGLVDYSNWEERTDWETNNRRLMHGNNGWVRNNLEDNFDRLFDRFKDSLLVISYGEPGTPSIQEIEELLLQYKSEVTISKTEYKYKLNRKNGKEMREVLMIAE